ncbi:hypothetical protein QN085_15810 [Pseudomonas sp. M2(2023)]|uniref:hypothetical protein n=1 Tax=Pseudomonas sp. M2(2023) TaxID=3049084 RepID=UPI002555AD3A|nr:hypothetical protein [Pseudomonas sp. M2(2023)]WIV22148.1 hypothetical protein QN085_15810 [Pseudomonas sp. M2(2023)]
MALLGFTFDLRVWSASQSILTMNMLAQQAESNIRSAIEKITEDKAIEELVFEDEDTDQNGQPFQIRQTYYSFGPVSAADREDVITEYSYLITQLMRRSAYLTIFGLFEARLNKILETLEYHAGKSSGHRKPIEESQKLLDAAFRDPKVESLNHLMIIRNICAHSDGVAENYNEILERKHKLEPKHQRLIKAIERTHSNGISVNFMNMINIEQSFLPYAISEFERYLSNIELLGKHHF